MTYQPLALAHGPVNQDRIAEAADFADRILAPNAEAWDKGEASPETALRDAISRFAGTAVPRDLGGFGDGVATQVRIYEELARRDMGFTCALAVHTNVTVAISVSPNVALRDAVLPRLLSGKAVGAFLLTEPGAGSDATAITTHAQPVEGGYAVTGRKAWVTNGLYADIFAAFCQTDPGSGARGVAALGFARTTPGLTVEPALDLIGSTAMGTTDLTFDAAFAPEQAVAFAPGTAFKAAMYGIDVARLGVAAMCNGAAMGAMDRALAYAADRQTFGRALIDHQGMQWILSDAATAIEASRSLTFQAARHFETGRPDATLTAHAKKLATRSGFDTISQAMRALGANGLKREYGLARQLAAVRVSECMDGTGEIMNVVIGRSLKAQA